MAHTNQVTDRSKGGEVTMEPEHANKPDQTCNSQG